MSYVQTVIKQHWTRWQVNREVRRLVRQVSRQVKLDKSRAPVVLFNASTRLTGMSLNAAFSLLLGLGLQVAGIPVVRFACEGGMSRCVLGTNRDDPDQAPPCRACIAQSRTLFMDSPTVWFRYQEDAALRQKLGDLNVAQLMEFEWRAHLPRIGERSLPLGALALPALRWVLRRHHLPDEEPVRKLLREYILSAYRVVQEFAALVGELRPSAVVVFNGQFFPEAAARWVAREYAIPSVSHEVGLLPFTGYFTTGEATAYPLDIPDSFVLSEAQNARLDEYLSKRFKGQFSMAGVQFWPEMKGLDEAFLRKAEQFEHIVPIFTNVIFDTSQPHSNVIFPHMFAWLDEVLEVICRHPETLFVLRAHPDEHRAGKQSRESVADWAARQEITDLPNVVFYDSDQFVSSYQLIQRSKFVMIYNSTIGLEAAILGAPVLCAGRARFTQLPTVFFPQSPAAYLQQLETFLSLAKVSAPPEFQVNARRFLYYQLFRSSLPFEAYLQDERLWTGFVRLRRFGVEQLTAAKSPAMQVLVSELEKLDFKQPVFSFLLPE
jgi:hypothetical protein